MRLTFSDGKTDTADLLLRCDGIHSVVRTLYVDPEVVPEYSGLSIVLSFIPMSRLPSLAPSVRFMHSNFTSDGIIPVAHRTIYCSSSSPTNFPSLRPETAVTYGKNTRDLISKNSNIFYSLC